jgi:hypothetical protein
VTLRRQGAGAVSQLEKARLVAKLRAAREAQGKLGGRQGCNEATSETVALAKQLEERGRARPHRYTSKPQIL